MFKSARWRSDKNKIKAVFKLQFHATQLTSIGGDALTIAIVPGDVGKPTARLEKAKVKDGSCFWEKPHFETVKFTQDQKTGKINPKVYRFVVATGSSIFGVAGEVSLDFATYYEATKLSSLSLPLKNAKSTSVLHVTIQRVQDQREAHESENANEDNEDLGAHFSNGDVEGSLKTDSVEDHKVLTDDVSRNHGASSGSDITLSGSDSSSGLDTPREPEHKNTKQAHETSKTIYEEHKKSSQWDWLDGSVHESSSDDSPMISPRETLLRERSEEGSPDDVIKKLKGEIVTLARQAEVSEMEIQTLRKQIVKETKKGQDLSKEIAAVKEERNELKEECEKLKVKVNGTLLTGGGDPWALVDELRQELKHEKDLNSNLRLQLQKTQESNAELILAVRDLDEMLESKSKSKSNSNLQEDNSRSETDDEDQKALEEIVREHSGVKDAYEQEQKMIDLYNEVELYKRDKDELEMQMEQIALDYEILKQENHNMSYQLEQSQLQEELKMQYECSTSYASVNELESQIESLHNELELKSKELSKSVLAVKELETRIKNLEEDLDNQAEGFQVEMQDLIRAKVEQERRAIHAEESLRKVKLQNANAAGKLQEEFRRLSIEMASAFRENENAALKAMDEANQIRVEKKHLEELLKKVKEEFDYLGNQYENKLVNLSNRISLKTKQVEEMKEQIENISHELAHQKASYSFKILNLDGEIKERENEIRLVKDEHESLKNKFTDLENVKKDKDNEVERLKSRCNDMKQFLKQNEAEKENLKKQLSQLKGDLKKTTSRNNKTSPISRSPKEVTDMKDKIKRLEGQIKLKEIALERSEALFLEKEKDLKHKIEDLELQLEVLDQNIENSQVPAAQNPNHATRSDEEIHEVSSDIMEVLNKNKSMEMELKEMQERYSEISLKFAEVEGERQQLVMTIRNLKNSKLTMVHT